MTGEIEQAARLEMWRHARCAIDRVWWDLVCFAEPGPTPMTTRVMDAAWAKGALEALEPAKLAIDAAADGPGGRPGPLLDALARLLAERARVNADSPREGEG